MNELGGVDLVDDGGAIVEALDLGRHFLGVDNGVEVGDVELAHLLGPVDLLDIPHDLGLLI